MTAGSLQQRRAGIGRQLAFLGWFICTSLLLCVGCVSAFADDIVVIGNLQLDVSSFNDQTIGDLYLGRIVQLATGQRVEVVDLPRTHPARDAFYAQVLGRDPAQMRAFWAKHIFTGKGYPPPELSDEASVVHWVAQAPGRIGYVHASALVDGVQVLLRRELK